MAEEAATKMLTKDDILGAMDLATELVYMPEWGGSVLMKELNGAERDAYEAGSVHMGKAGQDPTPNLENLRARLVAMSARDPKDEAKRMFTKAEAVKLGAKSGRALARLFNVAGRLSGIGDKAIKDIEGNSEAAQSGDSG